MVSTWFSRDLGHRQRYADDGTSILEAPVVDELCVPGTRSPRISVLATLADIATGSLIQPEVTPLVPLTVDLDVHCDGVLDMKELVCTARMVKRGRTIQVLDCTFTDAGQPDRPLAISTVRFIESAQPSPLLQGRELNFSGVEGRMRLPFAEQLRAQVVAEGVAVLDRWEYVLQPTGTIQGGAITLLAELAAESALGAPVVDIDVHFLSAVRAGPARATARRLWDTGAQVEVRDEGNGNRLVASATALGR
jgi:acyl-coenzyme A thioesterase PaaI-like protein